MNKFSSSELSEEVVGKSITPNVSPILAPGSVLVTLHEMKLASMPFDADQLVINMTVEGPDMGKDFVGVEIDKMTPQLGRYKGQVATVQNSKWPFRTFTTKGGKVIERDDQIYNFINAFALHIGKLNDLKNAKINESTIEGYVESATKVLCDSKNKFWMTIAGQEYLNNKGYIAYRLFVPKPEKNLQPYAAVVAGANPEEHPENFMLFNPALHIIKQTPVSTENAAESIDAMPIGDFSGSPLEMGAMDADSFKTSF